MNEFYVMETRAKKSTEVVQNNYLAIEYAHKPTAAAFELKKG